MFQSLKMIKNYQSADISIIHMLYTVITSLNLRQFVEKYKKIYKRNEENLENIYALLSREEKVNKIEIFACVKAMADYSAHKCTE